MKFFLDTANLKEIEEAVALGVISGVTTNPSLVAHEGQGDFAALLKQICGLVGGPVSAEVLAETSEEMVQEALQLAALDREKIVIKIPMCHEGLKAVKRLSAEGIRTNVTLVFSAQQALLAAAAGASFVSPFAGRLDDIGQDGIAVIRDIAEVFDFHGLSAEIIAASVRHPMHVLEAAKAGAHIATVPFKIIEQMIRHPLTDAGIKRFQEDWKKRQ